MKTCIINTLFVIESLTIVNLLNKVQFPFVKVFPPQMLSSSSEGAIVQAVPIAFAPVTPKNLLFWKCQTKDIAMVTSAADLGDHQTKYRGESQPIITGAKAIGTAWTIAPSEEEESICENLVLSLTLIQSGGYQIDTCLPFTLYFWHGLCSEYEESNQNKVKTVFFK